MNATLGVLGEPLAIGTLRIAGRLVKSATSETRATDDGFATDSLIAFYRPMAAAGTPLIVSGNIYVSRNGQSTPRQLGVDCDQKIPALSRLTDAVHQHGSKIFAQLNHCGRQVLPRAVGRDEVYSASAVTDLSTGTRPRPLTAAEIRAVVDDFGAAADRCKQAGFDGVQIHAGHGYLISQFLTPYTNRRRDAYGGSAENRIRLLREIYGSIREQAGRDFPVIMKLNGHDRLPLRAGLDTAQLVEVAKALERDGLDGIEISVGHYESGFPVVRGSFGRCLRAMSRGSAKDLPWLRRVAFRASWPAVAVACNLLWPRRQGFNLDYARRFKAALAIPVICVGGFWTRAAIEAAIAGGACDAVAAGRAFIADPYVFRHLRDGEAGPRCVFCNACVGNIGRLPLDCYHPRVRAQKDAMLDAAR